METQTPFDLQQAIPQVLDGFCDWRRWMPAYETDTTLAVSSERWQVAFGAFQERLKDNYPFFHPLYAGQMIKPPHPVAVAGYLAAMLINPNNHALDGGPATARMEKECIQTFARQFGFTDGHIGHLTSGGTMANLEALWVARELHPDRKIIFAQNAHYTHERMCCLLNAPYEKIPATPQGQMDVSALEKLLKTEAQSVGTVVVTLGTTALGTLDPLAEVLKLKRQYGFRVHVDMAYGGYYHVLNEALSEFAEFGHVRHCDSVVIDPHKHGLQPYGCGCVIFADPSVSALYRHESPYTYFTSPDEQHLGEIGLECSRPGATAAALWLTMQLFPLNADDGMGTILRKTRQAALRFASDLRDLKEYRLYLPPALDIVTFFPLADSTTAISARTRMLFQAMMQSVDYPLYLATLSVAAEDFKALHPDIAVDSDTVTIFRSCLMKPEHADWAEPMARYLEHHALMLKH